MCVSTVVMAIYIAAAVPAVHKEEIVATAACLSAGGSDAGCLRFPDDTVHFTSQTGWAPPCCKFNSLVADDAGLR